MRNGRVNIAGVLIDNVTMSGALQALEALIAKREPSYVVTPNVDHIVLFQNDPEFRRIYREAACVLPDGMPLLWAGRLLGTPLREKVSGSDLVPFFMPVATEKGYRIFFLGGKPGSALGARERMEKCFPSVRIVGLYAPPFGFENDPAENEAIVRIIKEASPDILFVGLGTPKQEKWIYRYHKKTEVPVSIGVGATFEFMAGMVKRAPRWMQAAGLEWSWRLMMEPRRLWRRYFEDLQFFRLIFSQRMGVSEFRGVRAG